MQFVVCILYVNKQSSEILRA